MKELIQTGKGQAFRPLRGGAARDDPPRPRRPAGGRRPERILPLVAETLPRRRSSRRAGGAGHRPRSLRPAGVRGFLTGKIDENATFDSSELPHGTLPRFARGFKGESGRDRPPRPDRRAEGRRLPAQGGPGVDPRAEAVVRAHPGHDEITTAWRENLGAAGVGVDGRRASAISRTRPCRRSPCKGDRYPERLEQMTGR